LLATIDTRFASCLCAECLKLLLARQTP
jgi:hypothetical protein